MKNPLALEACREREIDWAKRRWVENRFTNLDGEVISGIYEVEGGHGHRNCL
jgi:hypothetical protein